MNEFFGSVWWLIVSLGLLVTFHEYGHYWVARRCGVRVLRFSVGFGRALWSRTGKDGTEYVIAALPLGGYVKMLDEREGDVAPQDRHASFNAQSVGRRIAIVAAGPAANLLLCLGLLWLMFVIGKPDYVPEIGRAEGLAAEAGFRPGDRLVDVGGRAVETWTGAAVALSSAVMDREPLIVRVREAGGTEVERRLPLDRPGLALSESQPLSDLGLVPASWLSPPVVGTIQAGSGAEGRLQAGDRVLAIGGESISHFDRIGPAVQRHARQGEPLRLSVERAGAIREVLVDPQLVGEEGKKLWRLGIGPAPVLDDKRALLRYGPVDAIGAAFVETGQMAGDTVKMLWRMVSGQASLENLSGPITIARVANSSASMGVAWFLYFLALLSLSLCIMNLLPIPVLDGGHLLYYLIELVKGRPVGEQVLVAGQYVGLALLAGLMGLAFYNDILGLVS